MDSLELYESFHLIQRQTTWGKFPWECICIRCIKWTLCEHTALMTSLFTPDVVVPDNLVAATPALRKKCSKIRGTAGPRRARLIKEIAKEKKSTSKIGFVDAPLPPQPDTVPSGSTWTTSPPPSARTRTEGFSPDHWQFSQNRRDW